MRTKLPINTFQDPFLNLLYNKARNEEKLKNPAKINVMDDPELSEIYSKSSMSSTCKFKTNKTIRTENDDIEF